MKASREISARAKEIERQFRNMPKPAMFNLEQERDNTRDAHVLTGVPTAIIQQWEYIAGLRCLRAVPLGAREDIEVIFIHGGAFCLMSAMTHHRLAGHVANALRCNVLLPDYSLAPEKPFPAARDECRAVIEERLLNGPRRLVLMGDSAGGGLALSATCRLRDQRMRLPDALVLMSPWLDLSLSGDNSQAGKVEDPMLQMLNLRETAKLYLAGTDPKDKSASPLWGDLGGLPPTLVQTAEKDLLRDDAERLAEKWPKDGTFELRHFEGMLHSFQMFAGDMPEADAALQEAADFVNKILD